MIIKIIYIFILKNWIIQRQLYKYINNNNNNCDFIYTYIYNLFIYNYFIYFIINNRIREILSKYLQGAFNDLAILHIIKDDNNTKRCLSNLLNLLVSVGQTQ